MATCTLKYIEDSISDRKDELTDIHFEIMSELLSSQTEAGNKLFTDVKLSSGKKVVFLTSKLSSSKIHKQQRERIAEINTKYSQILLSKGFDVNPGNGKVVEVKSVKLSPNNKEPHDVVVVHLLNYIPADYTEAEFNSVVEQVALDIQPEVFDNGLISTDYDILSQVEERKDAVLEQLEVLLEKADSYITNVINNKNADNRLEYLDSSIKSLYWSVKNSTDDVSKMANILEYMSKANSILNRLKNNVKITTERIKTLNKNSPSYDKDISNIATYLNETEQIMAFLEPFKAIIGNIEEDKTVLFWSKYNLHKIVKDFKVLASMYNTPIEDIENVLKNKIPNEEVLLNYLQSVLSAQDVNSLREELKIILTEATLENSKTDAFENIASNVQRVQTELSKDYYEFIATVLYNKQLERFDVESESEITDPKRLSYFESKALIKKKLQIADSDVSITNWLLAGGYDINDTVARLTTSVVDDYVRMGKVKNNNLTLTYEEDIEAIVPKSQENKRRMWDSTIVQKILTIDPAAALIEVDDTYTGPKYTKFGKIYKVRETNVIANASLTITDPITKEKKLVKPADRAKFYLDYRIHKETYKQRAEHIVEVLLNSEASSGYENRYKRKFVEENIPAEDLVYLKASGTLVYSNDRGDYSLQKSLDKIEEGLNYGFTNFHEKIKSEEDIDNILYDLYSKDARNTPMDKKDFFESETILAELNKKVESDFFRLLFHKGNVKRTKVRDNNLIYSEERKRLFGQTQKGVYLRSPTGEFIFYTPANKSGNIKLPEEYSDYTYYKLGNNFTNLVGYEDVKSQALDDLFKSDPKAKEYYDLMLKKYNEANDKYEGNRFRFNELPFISTEKTATFWETISDKDKALKSVKDWFIAFKYKDSNVSIKYGWDENNNRIFVDKDGNPSNTPYYIQLSDQHGDPLREVIPGYTKYLSKDEQQEKDLKVSMFMFNFAANDYEAASTAATLAPTIKTILKGSKAIQGLNAREAGKKSAYKNKILLKTANYFAKKEATRITESILNMLDNIVYNGDQQDTNVLGVSGKVAARRIKGLMAWTQLALNVKSGLTNFSYGTLSNYLAAASKKHGLSEKEMRIAYAQYRKNIPSFAADLGKKTLAETSLMTQMATYFNAIKGDREDGRTSIDRKDPLKSGIMGLLYSTSTLPEHANQLVLMQALYNTYTVLSLDGKDYTMGDFVLHEKGKAFTFDYKKLESLGVDRNTWDKKILRFTAVVTSVNQKTHGQYDILDKGIIQQRDLLSLGWVYSKWIYPGWKNRFGDEAFNYRNGEIDNEGYFKTHFRFLMKNASDMNEKWEDTSFLDNVWNYAKANPAKIPALLGGIVGKQAAAVFDRLSFRQLSKNNKTFSEWIYGDENISEAQKIAILRANLEITFFIAATIIGLGAHALADDEEEDSTARFLLKQLELQSKRTANDLGLYMLYTTPLYAKNKLRDKLKDPFIVGKIFDNNTSLLWNIFGVSYDTEEGLGVTINDKYDRSGPGYEKGDYKVTRKLEKSVFSPIYQLYTFMDPEQSLKFMDMLNRK